MSDNTSFYREQQNNIREHIARIDCSMAEIHKRFAEACKPSGRDPFPWFLILGAII
jgi:hypothetical protein